MSATLGLGGQRAGFSCSESGAGICFLRSFNNPSLSAYHPSLPSRNGE